MNVCERLCVRADISNTHTHTHAHTDTLSHSHVRKLSLLSMRLRSESQLDFPFAITLSGGRCESVIHLFIASVEHVSWSRWSKSQEETVFGLMLAGFSRDAAHSSLSLPPSRFRG